MKKFIVLAGVGAALATGFGIGLTAPHWLNAASATEFTRPAPEKDKHLIPLNKHLWIIYATDTPELRAAVAPEVWAAHVKFDIEQETNGTRVMGGAVSDRNGKREYGMFIVRAANAEEADRIAHADPAVQAGERTVSIHQFEAHEGVLHLSINFSDGTASFK